MTPHHDNIISGDNPFNSDNSHIYGGPVISVSFGAEMFYHTIYPNLAAGQDYSMCQTEAKDNLKDGFKTSIPLEDMSIYIHPAHDYELYYHCLTFEEDGRHWRKGGTRNGVRFVFIFRWLSASAFFRCNPEDPAGHRHAIWCKDAFDSLDSMPKFSKKWYKAMEYKGNPTKS